MEEILRQLENARIIDLAQPYYIGMPHHPAHPPYLFGMTKTHGEYTMGKASSAAESIALGGHLGTHIDALSLFSLCGKLYGGIDAVQNQSYSTGLQKYDVDTIEPIFSRAVLLDIASYKGVDVLSPDFMADADCLSKVAERQEIRIHPGDIVLINTGWDYYWHDASKFINRLRCPGPNGEAAHWLSEHGIFALVLTPSCSSLPLAKPCQCTPTCWWRAESISLKPLTSTDWPGNGFMNSFLSLHHSIFAEEPAPRSVLLH